MSDKSEPTKTWGPTPKTCKICGISKANVQENYVSRHNYQCRQCLYERSKTRLQQTEDDHRAFINAQKEHAKCIRCGYADGEPVEYCFVYKTGEERCTKKRTKKRIRPSAMTLKQMEKELPKVDLMCRNCHRETDPMYVKKNCSVKCDVITAEKFKRGQCCTCGYKVNWNTLPAFDFDHIDSDGWVHNRRNRGRNGQVRLTLCAMPCCKILGGEDTPKNV